MAQTSYRARSLRRHGAQDVWEATLSHKGPITGEDVRTYHRVKGKTRRQAERARDALILELERKGGALAGGMTVRELLESFVSYKERSGTVEPSTVRDYRGQAKNVCRYIGNERAAELSVAAVNVWMADMSAEGYAPKSVDCLDCGFRWSDAYEYSNYLPVE